MDTGPEIEIELYDTPTKAPVTAPGADRAAATPPAVLATAATFLVWFVVYFGRLGARVAARERAEAAARRATLAPAPVAPAPTAPAAAPAVDPLTEAREARAAWEAADLRWEAHPRDGWAGLVSPFLRGWDGRDCRDALKRAGARWDAGAKWWECRVAAVPAVNEVCARYYGRAPVAFVEAPRMTAAPAARTATPPRGVPISSLVPQGAPARTVTLTNPLSQREPLTLDAATGERVTAPPAPRTDVAPALAAALGETTAPAPTERQVIPTVTASASDNAAAIERLALASRARRTNGARRTVETPEQRERRERLAADIAARRTLDNAITVALAGNPDGEYPHGCLAAWHPSGEVRWSVVADAAAAAGVSPPAERSLRAIAADAVRTIEGGGLRVSVVKRGSRWAVYRPARVTEAGASVGEAQVVAELQGDALVTDGPEDLCATVRDAFNRARREAVIGSAEVTAWLTAICHQLRGVSTVYGRWIPPGRATDTWRRVTEALNAARLPLPSRPAAVASRADVAEEIAGGLRREIEAEVARIAEDAARENYGTRAAVSALVDLAALRDKARMYAVITGPGALDAALAQMDALAAKLEPLADDTSQRGAALELY
jgi:hypothetical protein